MADTDEEDLSEEDMADAWGAALAEQGAGGDEDDDLAAAWGAALEEQGAGGSDDMAAQWAAMIDDSEPDLENATRGADRVLNQEEIDNLLGFNIEDTIAGDQSGIRALINSAMVSYERLPMLEIVFDRLVRLTTTSLRNFTSDNVEVSLDSISSVRFGDYLNSIPLPAILGVFKAEEWDGFGLITVESSLIYSIIDVLLGGGRGTSAVRVEGRPYTTIETGLVQQMVSLILQDAEQAFAPLSPVHFNLERLETNPRFAAISRPANAAILVELRIDMEDRGGVGRDHDALCDAGADPRSASADVHGREIRPRSDLGRPSGLRDPRGGGRGRCGPLRNLPAARADSEPGRRPDAGVRCGPDRSRADQMRQCSVDGGDAR